MAESAGTWARHEFGRTLLGDVRRTKRLVHMAEFAAKCPSGTVAAVFNRAADREGAYDFLESPHVRAETLAESVFTRTAERARGESYVFVSIDGSSLALPDENGAKGFGSVGSPNREVKGLMVVNALAVSNAGGVSLGLIDQIYWNRSSDRETGLSSTERTKRNQARAFEDKEPSKLVEAAKHAKKRLAEFGVTPWVVIDREGDNRDILLRLHEEDCLFTIRARWNRQLWDSKAKTLEQALDAEPSLGSHEIEIARSGARAARTATVEVRATQVFLHFKGHPVLRDEGLRLWAVRVREVGAQGEPLNWLLYTNVPVLSVDHAKKLLESYRARWRVEEFHRTWKQGQCNVEDAQLRSQEAVIKWATILAAVASRIERLKYLSRHEPNAPAAIEFLAEEIEALKFERIDRGTKRSKLPEMPTIREATRWAAEIGGWMGDRSGPPGSITIARGLQRLAFLVEGIALARRMDSRAKPRRRRT